MYNCRKRNKFCNIISTLFLNRSTISFHNITVAYIFKNVSASHVHCRRKAPAIFGRCSCYKPSRALFFPLRREQRHLPIFTRSRYSPPCQEKILQIVFCLRAISMESFENRFYRNLGVYRFRR